MQLTPFPYFHEVEETLSFMFQLLFLSPAHVS